MARATPDPRLRSQVQGITALLLVLNYTAQQKRQMCVSVLPRDVSQLDSNPRPVDLACPALYQLYYQATKLPVKLERCASLLLSLRCSTKLYCLVTEAHACTMLVLNSARGETRTRDLLITSSSLYPPCYRLSRMVGGVALCF